MKKLLTILAAALCLAVASPAPAVVRTTRYVFNAASYYQVSITIGNVYDPAGPTEVQDGTVIFATWNGGCAPAGAQVGYIQYQVWNDALQAWVTQTSAPLFMPQGCESTHLVVWTSGSSEGANSESPYCPCH